MQREIIEFNKKYKTDQLFFGGCFDTRSKCGLKWITLDEYKINEKVEIKKSTQPHEYQGFGGLY